MNWDDIKIFLEVARSERLSIAAKRLAMDASTVSRRLHKLEQQLESQLFERTIDGHVLTDDGKKLLNSARQMEQNASNALEQIKNNNQANCGKVRIGVTEAFGNFFVAAHLLALQQDFPDIQIDLLHFSRFVIRLQKHFAESIKENFITHLKLRGWWKDYELSTHKLTVRMNEPTHFNVLRKQQLFEIQSSNFASMAGNELISELYAQKRYLDWDDDEILTNQAWLAKEKAIKWRLMNIEQFGPDWRKQAENAEGQAADDFNPTGGGGSGLDDLGGEDFGGEGGVEGGEDESVPPDGLGGGGAEAAPDESES
jgi:molybdenum-dependent DNA-binding transcriptional regulator ModE